jgi:hypothetical protein
MASTGRYDPHFQSVCPAYTLQGSEMADLDRA